MKSVYTYLTEKSLMGKPIKERPEIKDEESISDFSRKAIKGDVEGVLEWLDKGMNPNVLNSWGKTALENALSMDRYEVAEALLKRGADINMGIYNTFLKLAKDNELIELVSKYDIVESKVYENVYNWISETSSPNDLQYRLYIDKITSDDNLVDLLHLSIRMKNIEIVRDLIKRGADVNRPNTFGNETPLQVVARVDAVEIAKELIDSGADIRKKGRFGNFPYANAKSPEMKALLMTEDK